MELKAIAKEIRALFDVKHELNFHALKVREHEQCVECLSQLEDFLESFRTLESSTKELVATIHAQRANYNGLENYGPTVKAVREIDRRLKHYARRMAMVEKIKAVVEANEGAWK